MSLTLEELKDKILAHYDPDELVEYLQISSEELIGRFEDKVLYYRSTFEKVIEGEDDEFMWEDYYADA